MYHNLVHNIFLKINKILDNKWIFIGVLLSLSYILGVIGFLEAIPQHPDEPFVKTEGIGLWVSSLVWALLNLIIGSTDTLSNKWIISSQTFAYIAIVFAIIITFIKSFVATVKLKTINNIPHTLIIGLGENNRTYLESEIASNNTNSIIIIEPDSKNLYLDYFTNAGFSVFVGTLYEHKVNFTKLERVVISTGIDRVNIEMAGSLIEMVPRSMTQKEFGEETIVHVHLENQDYKELFQKEILSLHSNLPMIFKVYSFNDDAARQLFENHTILGNYYKIAEKNEPYSVVVIGDGNLAERIIYHLCMQANLPNKNHLTIHCVSKDATKFLKYLHSNFMGIELIKETVSLKGHSLDMDSVEFFSSKIYKEQNLTNVIVCSDNENINLECIVNLHDKVFLRSSSKTKVHFAMYHNMTLSQKIDDNKEEFNNFYSFGNAKFICAREQFIDEKYENIAKQIHSGYAIKYEKDQLLEIKKANQKWQDNMDFHKRDSNRSQALHINTKLMSMGFKKIKAQNLSAEVLLKYNHQIMKPIRDKFPFDDAEVIEASSKLYTKQNIDLEAFFSKVITSKDIFSKLCIAEHERWNVFHYLNGWLYGKRDDTQKYHNCLVPIKDFSDINRQETIIYDLYATLYIPNYLASSGYRIVPIEDVSIGITGHRNIDVQNVKLQETLGIELNKVMLAYGRVELISPLAKGADRLFIDTALNLCSCKIKNITIPMPFNKEDYKKDFISVESKANFEDYLLYNKLKKFSHIVINTYELDKNSRTQELTSLEKYSVSLGCKTNMTTNYYSKNQKIYDQAQYEKVGKEVVDTADVLFAIWDGEEAKGKGGTGDIVQYARDEGKYVVHIHSNTLEVMYINAPCAMKPNTLQ